MRGCTPHFKALGKEKSSILGVDQAATDLSEQQLKVLRLGDSSFSAHQYVQAADQEHSVVLGPGDVMYHPAGAVLCIAIMHRLLSHFASIKQVMGHLL